MFKKLLLIPVSLIMINVANATEPNVATITDVKEGVFYLLKDTSNLTKRLEETNKIVEALKKNTETFIVKTDNSTESINTSIAKIKKKSFCDYGSNTTSKADSIINEFIALNKPLLDN